MEKVIFDRANIKHTFIKLLVFTVLAFLIIVSIAGAAPFAYIKSSLNNTVSVIDTATNNITATVNVGKQPFRVVVSSDGKKVYVVNRKSNFVSVIDTGTNTVATTVYVGQGESVNGVAVTPDGKKVYVTKGGNLHSFLSNEGNVSVIDAATNVVKTTVNLGSLPNQIVIGNIPHRAPADFNYLIIASMVVLYIRKKLS